MQEQGDRPGGAVDIGSDRTLRPSPLNLLGLTALCVPFIAGAVWAIGRQDGVGWFVLAIIVLAALVLAANLALHLLPGGSALVLDAEGFCIRLPFRSHRYRWSDVDHFGVVSVGGNAVVGINFSSGHDRSSLGRKVSASLCGWEAALPDTYGLSAGALADLLNEYKKASWLRGGTGAGENAAAPAHAEGIRAESGLVGPADSP